MAFDKFDPYKQEADDDPLRPRTVAAGRRAWVLRWGTWITTAMLVLGYAIILYQLLA